VLAKLRATGDRETQNIFELEVDKILSKASVKLAEVLNLFSFRFSFFFNFALLGFSDRILTEPFSSR
jgi:hypothetical protein